MDRVDNPFARQTGWGRLGQQAVSITPEQRTWTAPRPRQRTSGVLTGSALPMPDSRQPPRKAHAASGVLTGSALPPPLAPSVERKPDVDTPQIAREGLPSPAETGPRLRTEVARRKILIVAGAVVVAGVGLSAWLVLRPVLQSTAGPTAASVSPPVQTPAVPAMAVPEPTEAAKSATSKVAPLVNAEAPPRRSTRAAQSVREQQQVPRLKTPTTPANATEIEPPLVVIPPLFAVGGADTAPEVAPEPTRGFQPPGDLDAPIAARPLRP